MNIFNGIKYDNTKSILVFYRRKEQKRIMAFRFPGTSKSSDQKKFNRLIEEIPTNDVFMCNVIITYQQMKEDDKPNALYYIKLFPGGILADFCWLFEFLTDKKFTKTKLFVDLQGCSGGFKVTTPITNLKRRTYSFVASTEATLLCSDHTAQFIIVRQ